MEDLTVTFEANPKEYYSIVVQGYIEPTAEPATLSVIDMEGRILAHTRYNANSGIFNASLQVLLSNFYDEVTLTATLENANWVLTKIIQPTLFATRVR